MPRETFSYLDPPDLSGLTGFIVIVTAGFPGMAYRYKIAEQPYARVGDQIGAGQFFGVQIAMKLCDSLCSPVSGTIVRFFFEFETAIDAGSPLVAVRVSDGPNQITNEVCTSPSETDADPSCPGIPGLRFSDVVNDLPG